MSSTFYDVVIVGAGIAGALISKRLTAKGMKVLLLEAGTTTALNGEGYQQHLDTFYQANGKGAEAPWPPTKAAPQPDTADLRTGTGYFVQRGPDLYGSSYTRLAGGSTLHFLGVSLRMLPEDFRMKSLHGISRDWPLRYEDLEPYYSQAEHEIGVSANADEQSYLGISFAEGYDYPMERVPLSYSDEFLGGSVNGLNVKLEEESFKVRIRSYPAARNSLPRGTYKPIGMSGNAFQGGSGEAYLGQRCEGNTACIPICPVQAKYNAGKTLSQCLPEHFTLQAQSVASRVIFDHATGAVQGIEYKRYESAGQASYQTHVAHGRYYVLAAHAVENAKLMLASGVNGPNDSMGRTLMDHPTLYAWGLAPKAIGAYRGPQSTSGVEDFRGGGFRARHAAFRFDVGNDGWRAATGAPDSLVAQAVKEGRHGHDLRQHLEAHLRRQLRLSIAVEQLPSRQNRVTINPKFVDALGNARPVIDYRIEDYTLEGMVAASEVAGKIFHAAGVEDFTDKTPSNWFPSVTHKDRTFHYHGMGHFAGTHAMGSDRTRSVVDRDQRCWEHPNLFMVGSGSFPTMGTSNPTLTLAALALRTADELLLTFRQAA
ncbi:GMC family oxidoreductase [Agrobacterium larrymoorei]|uniref:GMC family oxidoreductase n=1 Tax=Agrobacterium larrymoorei TaxID=160699 RepID=A0AAF0HDG4_9HYPH|nr:GMC family oxidoreductase [Agrobacterium larrymoorei]WHA44033.1 GMC family oxidoreductase [Agrobacterium larrymoorei]